MDMIDSPYVQEEEEDEEKEEEKDRGAERLTEKLLKTRTILLTDAIDSKLARSVMNQLLILEAEDPEKEIKMFINSPGGAVDAGYAIFDMLKFIQPPIKAICTGMTASAAVVILLAAKKENRLSLPNARVMIHQPWGAATGSAADIEIEASEILKIREKINTLIADETGQDIKKVEKDTMRNLWLSAEEAKKYGLVSRIVTERKEL